MHMCDILGPENVFAGNKTAITTCRYGSRQKEVVVWLQAGQRSASNSSTADQSWSGGYGMLSFYPNPPP